MFFFGCFIDWFGCKKFFFVLFVVYFVGFVVVGFVFVLWFFYIWWFVVGVGIGGEYVVINLVIDEIILVWYCGCVDIVINGIYWGGVVFGVVVNVFFFNIDIFLEDIGWWFSFFFGLIFGLLLIYMCWYILESLCW